MYQRLQYLLIYSIQGCFRNKGKALFQRRCSNPLMAVSVTITNPFSGMGALSLPLALAPIDVIHKVNDFLSIAFAFMSFPRAFKYYNSDIAADAVYKGEYFGSNTKDDFTICYQQLGNQVLTGKCRS